MIYTNWSRKKKKPYTENADHKRIMICIENGTLWNIAVELNHCIIIMYFVYIFFLAWLVF